jgi:hypothetical protein
MHVIGIIIGLVGIIGAALKASGMAEPIRPVNEIATPIWLGVAVAGFLLWIVMRRPSD